jgi:multiple sugar transport system ATP-binding protein
MKDGVVNQIGTPLEVYDFPANRFVASFIGSPEMNFLDGNLIQEADKLKFVSPNGMITIDVESGKLKKDPPRAVTLGFRPEHIKLTQENAALNRMQIEVIEHLGVQTLVIGKVEDLSIAALMDRTESLRYGMNVTMKIDSKNVHFFDQSSGGSLK